MKTTLENKKNVEFFRDSDTYTLTIDQHAALASALNHALDRVGTADDRLQEKDSPEAYENIMERPIFCTRYERLLRKAWKIRNLEENKNEDKTTLPLTASHSKCSFIENDEVKWNEAIKYLQKYLENFRNYFTHYVHLDTKIKEIGEDKIFQDFLQLLEQEARETWMRTHSAWIDTPDQADKELYQAVNTFSWSTWKTSLGVYESKADKAPVSMYSLLLFISIFSAKDLMHKLLNKLHIFKQYDKDTTQEILTKTTAKEVFTSLSLPARFDAQSANNKGIIAAWTILDSFAHRLGKRTHYKKQTRDIVQKPLPDACMAINFNQQFYIRMLVNIMEACKVLPNITVARTYEGRPIFDDSQDDNREIYIRHNAVAISWKAEGNKEYYGQLSMNALMAILCAWLKENDVMNPTIKNSNKMFGHLTALAKILQEKQFPQSIPEHINHALPQFFVQSTQNETVKDEIIRGEIIRDKTKDKDPLLSRIEALESRYFAKNMPPHRQAISILWWVNRLLPNDRKISKENYSNALIYAVSNNIEMLRECLPTLDNVPDGEAKNILASLYGAIKTAKGLVKVFAECQKSFKNALAKVCTTGQRPYNIFGTQAKKDRLAQIIGLRRIKQRIKGRGKSQNEAWVNFQTRFKCAATLPPWRIWELLELPNEPNENIKTPPKQKGSQGNIPLGKFLSKTLKGKTADWVDNKILPEKYYKHSAFKIRNADRLLLHLTKRILENCGATKNGTMTLHLNEEDFTYKLKHCMEDFTLIIPHTQARRSYVSRHPDRIKNVIDHYWTDKSVKEIPFAWQPASLNETKPERADNVAPRDFLEAESDMEQERFMLIKAVLLWERDIAKNNKTSIDKCLNDKKTPNSKNQYYLNFKEMLNIGNYNNDNDFNKYNDFRNWALHQSPRQAFSTAPGELGKRFAKIKEDNERRKRESKKKGMQNKFKKIP